MGGIHPTAIIDPAARIDPGASVGPYCVVGPDVQVGPGCVIGPHVVLAGDTVLGPDNAVGPFSTIGMTPQDLKYRGEKTRLRVGRGNTFREYVNVSTGSVDGSFETVIGDHNLFMSYVHVAHDCVVGSHTIFANTATLAGHITIGDHAVIGGLSAIHQFVHVGAHAMIGGGAMVAQDVPPYVTAVGDRAKPAGVNTRGISRRGFDPATIAAIKTAYRYVYRERLALAAACDRIDAELVPAHPALAIFTAFCRASTRGIIRD
jgi:UDP-N-acetylglucosamine acyltransferase